MLFILPTQTKLKQKFERSKLQKWKDSCNPSILSLELEGSINSEKKLKLGEGQVLQELLVVGLVWGGHPET